MARSIPVSLRSQNMNGDMNEQDNLSESTPYEAKFAGFLRLLAETTEGLVLIHHPQVRRRIIILRTPSKRGFPWRCRTNMLPMYFGSFHRASWDGEICFVSWRSSRAMRVVSMLWPRMAGRIRTP